MRPLSKQRKRDIVALAAQGMSARNIAKQLGVSVGIVSQMRASACPNVVKPPPGRPRMLNAQQERAMVRDITAGRVNTAVDLQKDLAHCHQLTVTAQTIRNALKRRGLKAAAKVKKPLLTKRHRRLRMLFARKYEQWTVEDWKRVVFSDETKVNRYGSDGRKWCWKQRGALLPSHQVSPTVKHGGGSLMVWGCFMAQGVGNLVRIDATMDRHVYLQILQEDLLGSLDWYGVDKTKIVFQHDNDPKHTSNIVTAWLANEHIEVLDWPPQSPDLNPIEHVWRHFKMELAKHPTMATSMHELWERAEEAWNKIPTELLVHLIESMPEGIATVIAANGGYTRF
jgi:transposase